MSRELVERFFVFARRVRDFCVLIKRDIINTEYIRQLIRASGSVAANYLEASDDLGLADEKMRIKISWREAKESKLWLGLILTYEDSKLEQERFNLLDESEQIKKILSTILNKL